MAGRRGRVASSSWRRSDPELCHFNERFLPRWRKLAAFFGCETDVPTIAEAGVPGYVVMAWQRLVAPAGLPAPIVSRTQRRGREHAQRAGRHRAVARARQRPAAHQPGAIQGAHGGRHRQGDGGGGERKLRAHLRRAPRPLFVRREAAAKLSVGGTLTAARHANDKRYCIICPIFSATSCGNRSVSRTISSISSPAAPSTIRLRFSQAARKSGSLSIV